ncbi:MAG: RIP metalloprotease RseP [Clostridia bacterium]|nr:RIP metalloprotease RseP [Clostridia bacterium]
MPVVLSILIMILMLSVLTIVHEWGHFICARIFKVKVVEFSIFMGPKLFQKTSKKTGTKFTLRAIPLGGYCAFEDDQGDANAPDSLYAQKWYKRAIIFAGGVTMNFLLAWLITTFIVGSGYFTTTRLEKVSEDSIAYFVGIREGDSLVKFDDLITSTGTDVTLAGYGIEDLDKSDEVMHSHYVLTYRRDGSDIKYDISKIINYKKVTKAVDGTETEGLEIDDYSYTVIRTENGKSTEYVYTAKINSFSEERDKAFCTVTKTVDGVKEYEGEEAVTAENYCTLANSDFHVVSTWNPFELIGHAFLEMISMIKSVYVSLWWIITGKIGLNGLAGPIGLTSVVSDVVGAEAGVSLKIITLVNMAALISANLGVVNALPIPGLDGSHLLLILIEVITGGKKLPPKTQAIISYVGLGLMILLAVFVAGNDIYKLIAGG